MKPNVYTVIMCGGSGTRLWPVSRPSRPKQFVSLLGGATLFESTVARVRGLAGLAGLVVVAGERQAPFIRAQLPDDSDSTVLLEPEGRDSAAAIAAAAVAIHERDPDGIAVILASDHHVPDASAFREAVDAAVATARTGRIVTLGIRPREASPAYGYIKPEDGAGRVRPVAEFVEKPDRQTAARYITDGYLWNSGNFIARAAVLIEELSLHAPDVLDSVRLAVADRRSTPAGDVLAENFRETRKISIDYAVMEQTARASVVSADLDWSDLGAWDAVHGALPKDAHGNAAVGPAELVASHDTLVFNRTDRSCVVEGGEGLNVVVEDDCVFVSTLARSQNVKAVVEGLRARDARETDVVRAPFDLHAAAAHWSRWLATQALPLWWTNGFDHEAGVWREELDAAGLPTDRPARARVQGRQTFCYALAGPMGWPGPTRRIVEAGLAAIDRYCTQPNLLATLVAADGTVLDDRVLVYDQTFHVLALAAGAGTVEGAEERALAVLDAIESRFARAGTGFVEADDRPYQSNAHMHLFEACLEWIERGGGSPRWCETAARLADLATTHFIDARGFVREFFDQDWQPAAGADGCVVEPGHQFEWSWLLARWSVLADDERAASMGRRLFEAGESGIDPRRGLAVDTMDDRLKRVTERARFWPQTEWLKAACLQAELSTSGERDVWMERVAQAHVAFSRYLDATGSAPGAGLWFDKNRGDGTFEPEPSPASSFYHIVTAVAQLRRTSEALGA